MFQCKWALYGVVHRLLFLSYEPLFFAGKIPFRLYSVVPFNHILRPFEFHVLFFGCKINVWAIARKQKEKSPNKNRNMSEAHKSKRKFAIIFCTFIKSSRCFMYTDQVNICFYRVGWLCWQLCQSLMLLSPGNLLLVKTSQWNSILIVT